MAQEPTVNHVQEVIDVKQLNDGSLAVLCRCCQDTSTDSWATIDYGDGLTEMEIDGFISRHKKRIADQHEGMKKVKQYIASRHGVGG